MSTRTKCAMALWVAGLGAGVLISGCEKPQVAATQPTAAEKAAAEKAAADKALADKAAAEIATKVAVEKALAEKATADAAAQAAADKLAAEKRAGEKAAVEKALADKTAADQLAAEKAAAAQAAADRMAAQKAAADKAADDEKAQAAALPADLVLMKSELSQANSQIDIAIAKLEVLAVSPDLKQSGKDALAAIDTLDETAQSVRKRATDMRDRGSAYFDAWNKQLAAMSTPEVAAIATHRKDELAAKYAEVLTSMQETRAAFDPFWTEMQSIRKTVDDNLKPETQKELPAQIKSVKEKAVTLKGRVEATAGMLNQVSGIYTRR